MKDLPITSLPGIFGMNDNADTTKHLRETDALLNTALLTQVKLIEFVFIYTHWQTNLTYIFV